MPEENISFDYPQPGALRIKLSGEWLVSSGLPSIKEIKSGFSGHADITQITFDASGLSRWDSSLVSFLFELIREAQRRNINVIRDGLPQGAQGLLALALRVHEKVNPPKVEQERFFAKVGGRTLKIYEGLLSLLDFLGEVTFSFGRLIRGKAHFPREEFIYIVQGCGAGALPLVSLISILVGIILAFVGAIQLELFGAQIFIADIVGIAMVRMMGVVMAGILLSGRTGASFAAQLGIMQANEEIDALRTCGVNPIEYLVVPRVLALVIMMPLLALYADFMGILGGFIVSTGMLGINPVEYLQHTRDAVKLNNLWVGLTLSVIFGVIIAVAGCMRGIKCERNSAAIGEATTSAVVSAITGIVIATAIVTFICQVLGV